MAKYKVDIVGINTSELKVLKNDETINMILLNMIDMLEELSNDYKENVKII